MLFRSLKYGISKAGRTIADRDKKVEKVKNTNMPVKNNSNIDDNIDTDADNDVDVKPPKGGLFNKLFSKN